MLKKAKVFVAGKLRRGVKSVCRECGKPVMASSPRKYCDECLQRVRRAAGIENFHIALDEPKPVEVRAGFCRACGCIRLSRCDLGEVCAECRSEGHV